MIRRALKALTLGLLCGLMAAASGCAIQPIDSLYALPALAEEYSELQTSIDAAMGELGAEYAVINYGSNTSTIQLLDLDGNGTQEAAAVFLRVTSAGGDERPLRICLFRRTDGDSYRLAYTLEGDGSSINSVAYEDLTGDGNKEMIVSWQMGAGVYTLSAYSLNPADSNELLSVAYNESYLTTDLDRDENREIVVLQRDSNVGNDRAEYYEFRDGSMVMTSSALLSQGMQNVVSAAGAQLAEGIPGVYVTLDLTEGGQVTDVFTLSGGALVNLTRDQDSGVSQSTFRSYTEVAPADIDGDGVLEIPIPMALEPLDPEAPANQYFLRWRQFDERGGAREQCVTYHSTVDGWYLTLPDSWLRQVTAVRDDSISNRGERAVIFYFRSGGEYQPFLAIYRLTGNNRQARANLPGRFTLYSDSSTIYCAQLDPSVWACGTDETDLLQRFSIITAEWSNH